MLTRRPKYNSSGDLLGFSVPVAQIKRSISLATDGGSSIDRPCIVSNLVQTPKESGKRMKDVELEREAINLFFAGPSSTSAALTAIFYFLGKPKGQVWQARIRSEFVDMPVTPSHCPFVRSQGDTSLISSIPDRIPTRNRWSYNFCSSSQCSRCSSKSNNGLMQFVRPRTFAGALGRGCRED